MLGMRRVEYTGNGPSETHFARKWGGGPVGTFIPDPILGGITDIFRNPDFRGYYRKKFRQRRARTLSNSLLFIAGLIFALNFTLYGLPFT